MDWIWTWCIGVPMLVLGGGFGLCYVIDRALYVCELLGLRKAPPYLG